jgi:hypothetical protein
MDRLFLPGHLRAESDRRECGRRGIPEPRRGCSGALEGVSMAVTGATTERMGHPAEAQFTPRSRKWPDGIGTARSGPSVAAVVATAERAGLVPPALELLARCDSTWGPAIAGGCRAVRTASSLPASGNASSRCGSTGAQGPRW